MKQSLLHMLLMFFVLVFNVWSQTTLLGTVPIEDRKWVDAWAVSYLSTTINGVPQAVPTFSNQTLRLNMFSSWEVLPCA